MADQTKIDWCDASWNPVTGCLHGCPYCYARAVAIRFGGHVYAEARYVMTPDGQQLIELEKPAQRLKKNGEDAAAPFPLYFKPTFHRYRLDDPQEWKKPRTIFVCSMADLFGEWVPDEWISSVFEACRKAPWHTYLFLTKNWMRACQYHYEPNWWIGRTYTHTEDAMAQGAREDMNLYLCYGIPKSNEPYIEHENKFLSIEPIEGPVTDLGYYANDHGYKWVIVGAETGNRKEKVKPERAWVEQIIDDCRIREIPVFMKRNLVKEGVFTEAELIQEFPASLRKHVAV